MIAQFEKNEAEVMEMNQFKTVKPSAVRKKEGGKISLVSPGGSGIG
jgi:hypothetical protein